MYLVPCIISKAKQWPVKKLLKLAISILFITFSIADIEHKRTNTMTKAKNKGKVTPKQKKRAVIANKAIDGNNKVLFNTMFFPNSKKGELEYCNMVLNGKTLTFKSNTKSNINIDSISNMSDNIKKLFKALKPNTEKHIFAYRNTFPCYGLSDKASKSFKATIAYFYHKANMICINANRHYTFPSIVEKLNKAKLVFTAHKTYCLVAVTDDSLKKLVPVCNELIK